MVHKNKPMNEFGKPIVAIGTRQFRNRIVDE